MTAIPQGGYKEKMIPFNIKMVIVKKPPCTSENSFVTTWPVWQLCEMNIMFENRIYRYMVTFVYNSYL